MSSREERERLGRELEQRHLVPSRSAQAAIRREAEQVARRVQQRRDARKAAVEATLVKLREDPLDWLDD